MKKEELVSEFGQPDIDFMNLSLWIHKHRFPDMNDYWDGNWVNATVLYENKVISIMDSGPFIHIPDLEQLMIDLRILYKTLEGIAELSAVEPNLSLKFSAQTRGQINVEINIRPSTSDSSHHIRVDIDQSYLPELISSLEKVLERFPVKK